MYVCVCVCCVFRKGKMTVCSNQQKSKINIPIQPRGKTHVDAKKRNGLLKRNRSICRGYAMLSEDMSGGLSRQLKCHPSTIDRVGSWLVDKPTNMITIALPLTCNKSCPLAFLPSSNSLALPHHARRCPSNTTYLLGNWYNKQRQNAARDCR